MTPQERMVGALTRMALFRQAETGPATLVAYAMALSDRGCVVEDVEAACRQIETTERREGETAFPDLGKLLGEVERQGWAREGRRREALAAQAEKYFQVPETPALNRDEARAFMVDFRRRVEAARQR